MCFDSAEVNFENGGKDCIGNGEHVDENGELIECMCDECDYLAVCIKEKPPKAAL